MNISHVHAILSGGVVGSYVLFSVFLFSHLCFSQNF